MAECLFQEVERRKRYEDAYRVLLSERPKPIILGGPDYEVSPCPPHWSTPCFMSS